MEFTARFAISSYQMLIGLPEKLLAADKSSYKTHSERWEPVTDTNSPDAAIDQRKQNPGSETDQEAGMRGKNGRSGSDCEPERQELISPGQMQSPRRRLARALRKGRPQGS